MPQFPQLSLIGSPDNWQNPVHRLLFSLPVALVATGSPFPGNRPPARKCAIDIAFEFQRLLDEGVVDNRGEIARRHGLSRARVAQLLNLLELPPKPLTLLDESEGELLSERRLRALSSPEAQIAAVEELREPDR